MTPLKYVLGLALLLAPMTASSNELGLTESQLQGLLNLAPATKATVVKPAKASTAKSKQTKKKASYKPAKKKAKVSAVRSKSTKTVTKAKTSKPSFSCKKKYCKYMTSCAEARYQFKQCGHKGLDRDNDGIPCENVCL